MRERPGPAWGWRQSGEGGRVVRGSPMTVAGNGAPPRGGAAPHLISLQHPPCGEGSGGLGRAALNPEARGGWCR